VKPPIVRLAAAVSAEPATSCAPGASKRSLRRGEAGAQWLREAGCPTEGLHFDPGLVTRGLIVDKALGNLLKARSPRVASRPCQTRGGNVAAAD